MREVLDFVVRDVVVFVLVVWGGTDSSSTYGNLYTTSTASTSTCVYYGTELGVGLS